LGGQWPLQRKKEITMSEQTAHTPEPWGEYAETTATEAGLTGLKSGESALYEIAVRGDEQWGESLAWTLRPADAARITACVNALAGRAPAALADLEAAAEACGPLLLLMLHEAMNAQPMDVEKAERAKETLVALADALAAFRREADAGS
jgi:hypothetical protein